MCLCVIFFVKEHEDKYGGKRNREGDSEKKGKERQSQNVGEEERKDSEAERMRFITLYRLL